MYLWAMSRASHLQREKGKRPIKRKGVASGCERKERRNANLDSSVKGQIDGDWKTCNSNIVIFASMEVRNAFNAQPINNFSRAEIAGIEAKKERIETLKGHARLFMRDEKESVSSSPPKSLLSRYLPRRKPPLRKRNSLCYKNNVFIDEYPASIISAVRMRFGDFCCNCRLVEVVGRQLNSPC